MTNQIPQNYQSLPPLPDGVLLRDLDERYPFSTYECDDILERKLMWQEQRAEMEREYLRENRD
jgi:hypothetical protein